MTNPYKSNPAYGKDLCELMRRINVLATVNVGDYWGTYGYSLKWDQADPGGIAIDSSGYVYVLDGSGYTVRKFTATGTFITSWDTLYQPTSIAIDSSDYIYVGAGNYIRKYNIAGALQTSWGGSGTGNGKFNGVYGIVVGGGYVYASDQINKRVQIFNTSGVYQNQFSIVHSGDGVYDYPYGIALEGDFLFVIVEGKVRKFTTTGGYLTTWAAGTGDWHICSLDGLIFCSFRADDVINKYDLNGVPLETIGSSGSGNGQLDGPYGIIAIADGSIYVTEQDNDRVQKFIPAVGSTIEPLMAPIEFYAYSPATKASIGDYPDDDALIAVQFVTRNLTQMRTAIAAILAQGYYLNPATGEPYVYSGMVEDNLYYCAMGDRTKYGATGGPRFSWTRTEAQMKNTPLYDIDIGEIYECVVTLENADT